MIAEPFGSRSSEGSDDWASLDHQASDTVDLFQRVLAETLNRRADAAYSFLHQALLAVAEQHRGKCLDLDPVVIDLVKAALAPELRRALAGSPVWDEMSTCISKSIFADPQARARLNALWAHLQEALCD